ncbi:DMT family transporter [Neobacillus sp. D3-1R]|uniref:DMT family transporter n=1 Tax=Neobacillus sp. D3-1R TaxID=3445778 RepID=UPI003F9FB688
MKNSLIYAAAIMNASIIGLSFLFTKLALESTSPADTLGYRFLLAWIALSLYMFMFKRGKRIVIKWNKKTILALGALALFNPTLFFGFQAIGLEHASSVECGIIIALSPALTAGLSVLFLKERVNKIQVMFMSLSILGVIYISWMNGFELEATTTKWIGILFLFISCLSISSYSVLSRHLSGIFTPVQLTYIMVTFGALFFNGFSIFKKVVEGDILGYVLLFKNIDFLLSILFLGVLSTWISSLLSNYVLSKLSATKVSIFSNLSTVISIIAGAIFLKEEVHLYHLIGSMMIILGVLGMNWYKAKSDEKNRSELELVKGA